MQVLKDEIRNRILVAAENMFYQNGFKNTTTRSIAKEVGISVSNLYLYYDNKEAIFHAITDGFYKFFVEGLEAFLAHKDKDIRNIDVSHAVFKIIKTDQKKFVILADKSQGTKYEGFKIQITEILIKHIQDQLKREFAGDGLIIQILASNFIQGLVEIAKNYKDEAQLENSIGILFKYHMDGMRHLI